MGLERRSRSEDAFEDKSLFGASIVLPLPPPIQKPIIQLLAQQGPVQNLLDRPFCIFRVEDGARTHDLRNHNPLL